MNQNDPMAPKSDARGPVGPLAGVTHCTSNPELCLRFYGQLMGMQLLDQLPDPEDQGTLLGGGLGETRVLGRDDASPRIRLIQVDGEDSVRPDLRTLLHGGLSIGFAVADMEACVADAGRLGFESTAGIVRLAMQRGDGTPYDALETLFKLPDDALGLAVSRPPDLAPVAPVAAGSNAGGPAYSALVINHADADIAFFRDGLGYEVRRDLDLESSGPEGGLALAAGTIMRFVQLYSPGTATGYLVVLDFRDEGMSAPAPPRPPRRGVVCWSFRCLDLDATCAQAQSAGGRVRTPPMRLQTRWLGASRAATFETPSGLLVELLGD